MLQNIIVSQLRDRDNENDYTHLYIFAHCHIDKLFVEPIFASSLRPKEDSHWL
jgi:hypothetical protein